MQFQGHIHWKDAKNLAFMSRLGYFSKWPLKPLKTDKSLLTANKLIKLFYQYLNLSRVSVVLALPCPWFTRGIPVVALICLSCRS
jgi:hypothetical protein